MSKRRRAAAVPARTKKPECRALSIYCKRGWQTHSILFSCFCAESVLPMHGGVHVHIEISVSACISGSRGIVFQDRILSYSIMGLSRLTAKTVRSALLSQALNILAILLWKSNFIVQSQRLPKMIFRQALVNLCFTSSFTR